MEKRQLDELERIVGPECVGSNGDLRRYFAGADRPVKTTLVKPRRHEELGYAASYAYDSDIPMYTHRRGTLPAEVSGEDAILFDLSGMDEIIRIDEPNLLAFVEYGVTFERLKEELDRLGLRALMPASATSSSVVRSYVDRDVILAGGATRPYQLTIFHAILADGRLWMSGNDQMTPDGHSEFREDIGPMYSYFFHASEDIYGMPYAAKVFIYKRWEERRVSAHAFDEVEAAVKAAHLACRNDQVFECVVADSTYLSVLLAENRDDAEALAKDLPPWIAVFGFDNHPSLVDVWARQTAGIASGCGGSDAGGELERMMLEKFELPWYLADRDHYRGSTETIDCYAFTSKVPSMFAAAEDTGYPVGHVAIPCYYGAAFYCETDIYTDEPDERLREAWLEAYLRLLSMGAHVGRPRGEVANIIYEKLDEENIRMMKNLKRVLDPKGLLNRNQLLEGV